MRRTTNSPVTLRWIFIASFFGACGGSSGQPFAINFRALVGGMPFSCTSSYSNIGTTHTTIQPQDFRFYVHDVNLLHKDGTPAPLTLTPDDVWQSDTLALLDFEDGTGTCQTNSPEMHTVITGTAPPASDYTAISFSIGVPTAIDHLDVASAIPPGNVPALWWSWLGGYRYLRIDVQSAQNASWVFHLGAMNCVEAGAAGVDCTYPDEAVVTLADFDPSSSTITMDLATLYAESDLDAQIDPATEAAPGCMSDPDDPQCPPLFSKIGLTFQSNSAPATQTFFTVAP